MSPSRRNVAFQCSVVSAALIACSSSFRVVTPIGSSCRGSAGSGGAGSRIRVERSRFRMAEGQSEIEALRAAAAKAREEAAKLEQSLGKTSTVVTNAAAAATKAPSKEELMSALTAIDFAAGDAEVQSRTLDDLSGAGILRAWKAAVGPSASSASARRVYPVSLQTLANKSGGRLTAEALGIVGEGAGEGDVSLDDFRNALIATVVVSSLGAVGSLALLPPNIGATLCYAFALLPIVLLGIGSTAPGVIAGALVALRGGNDEASEEAIARKQRVARHEAGHFLCGYLCGLPVRRYATDEGTGTPFVEFHVGSDASAVEGTRGLTEDEVAALTVVALSGSVAEVLAYGRARGGENDLRELDQVFRRSEAFVGATKQQDLTRWGALVAYQLLVSNRERLDRLCRAFEDKQGVAECIAVIEGGSS